MKCASQVDTEILQKVCFSPVVSWLRYSFGMLLDLLSAEVWIWSQTLMKEAVYKSEDGNNK